MGYRAKQVLVILASLVVAGVMLLLGVWQMNSYEESTRDVSAERAAEGAVALVDQISKDGTIADIYGKPVTFTGSYLPDYQALVGVSGDPRVATAFQLTDGRYLTVVRGTLPASESSIPSPPTGIQQVEGIFLAPDKPATDPVLPAADLASLRVQELAQSWPAPLLAGYVTLGETDATAQGLGPAALELPEAEGSATHRGYALQWWVFAVGAVAFGVYVARGFKPAVEETSTT